MRKVSDATLLKMFRQVVILRAGNKCEYPNCSVHFSQLHPHHYYSKGNQSTRYDPLNGIALCHIHHTNGNESAHHDPNFKDVILNNFVRTNEWHWEVTQRKNQTVKNNDFYKQNWKITLKCELERLKAL